MRDADAFVSSFMEKLENNEFERRIEPMAEDGVELTEGLLRNM